MQQSTLDKLNVLAKQDKGNKQAFKNIVIKLGVKPVQHFPKLRDKDGKAVKDEDGNDRRSENSDGYTYTFSDFETSRIVKVVLNKLYDVKPMEAYIVSGLGYDIRSGNMIFIDEDVKLMAYKQLSVGVTQLLWQLGHLLRVPTLVRYPRNQNKGA